ncbi:MAG: hypothetical protein A2Z21_02320 [Candidatus Fraserbacteria bacterium RBG_16_55_9]|uniref:DUF35 domain-containing protein n=1 Tax=Fraserbacteria sp. (strain RBG_16_55_9) TaxID=1817864 RepID=A0A1F5V1U1_FRAXR|nr:MAG: hypothetical protein A2Z21_02320 [Candidatus Fraserbacteria bacterium RBG_16_55_9]
MTFSEKFQKTTDVKHWLGDMEVDHFLYTAGIAGEAFFVALRDKGVILGTRCELCGITYVPPRIYCEHCFAELNEYTDVGLRGRVRSFTIARLGKDGNELKKPEIFAVIDFGSGTTGLLHKLGEVTPETVKVGLDVEAVLKPKSQRGGHITDIEYFRPVG